MDKVLLLVVLIIGSSTSWALPTGAQLISGQATVARPIAGQMTINQLGQKAIIDWDNFSIDAGEIVTIQQPSFDAALLNRVLGQDASVIQGQLHANGQFFLLNPNGVLFSKSAQVDVGGLIASTHHISNSNFLESNYHFTAGDILGGVRNQGSIQVAEGGVVALMGSQVINEGTIDSVGGTTALVAGKTVDLDFEGDGLVGFKVSAAVFNAEIINKGAILADGGRVVLTAKAANNLTSTVLNSEGLLQAHSLVEREGEIILDGGVNGVTEVNGQLDTRGQTSGGKITVMGKNVAINKDGVLTAQALSRGTAGRIYVLGDMDRGVADIAGKLDASAFEMATGGFIETSAAKVTIADSAKITTLATNGYNGEWLIDPVDFTIAASGADMTGAFLSASLGNSSVTISSTLGTTGINGDVNINDAVTWSANKLTLNASRNININRPLNGSASAQLALEYAQGGTGDYFINKGAKINLPAGANFSTKNNTNPVINYTVITDLGLENSTTTTDLQGINNSLSLNYALGKDINAGATSAWNGGQGFLPIGLFSTSLSIASPFTGRFDGLGHTISDLTINRPSIAGVGLFAFTRESTIKNLGLELANIKGSKHVGGLVGYSDNSSLSNIYVTGIIGGVDNFVGGIIGTSLNNSVISHAYTTSNVSGSNFVGGVVGINNQTTINNTYATGNISGVEHIGGLVGRNENASNITNTYATGQINGANFVGGLVGSTDINASQVNHSFWDSQTTGQTTSAGGTNKTTLEMQQLNTFISAGWDISDTGGDSTVWRIYEGNTPPLLRSFLTPLTVSSDDISKTYNGVSDSILSNPIYSMTPNANLLGTLTPYGIARNIGNYTATGIYSTQKGYDILNNAGILTITPAALTITAKEVTKTYDGTTTAMSSAIGTGLFAPDSLTGGQFAFTDKNTGTGKTVTVSDVAVNDGNNGDNYRVTYVDNITSTITPATLTYIANNSHRSFGENNPVFTGSVTGFVNGETLADATSGTAIFTSLADSRSQVGNYSIEGSGLFAKFSNYIFLQANSNATALNITPVVAPPEIKTPEIKTPEIKTPEIKTPEIKTPELKKSLTIKSNYKLQGQISSLQTTIASIPAINNVTNNSKSARRSILTINDNFADIPCNDNNDFCNQKTIQPVLVVKNRAGSVKSLQISANKQFLSLLLEDKSIRVWDFKFGRQHRIETNKQQINISRVNTTGDLIYIANNLGIDVYDVLSSTTETTIKIPNVNQFVSADDNSLLLINAQNRLSLWNNLQNKILWQLSYQRGMINKLLLSNNNHYGAILSYQQGSYEVTADLQVKNIIDTVDIINLDTGKIIKSLPKLGKDIIYMHFKDNNTLQLVLNSGKVLEWSLSENKQKIVIDFAETITAADIVNKTYSYRLKDGTVRISDNQGNIKLSIQNKKNPFQYARLLADGKKLLTVMEGGELSLWDIASSKKILRLFSTKQGWTVMDAYGRFDTSEAALENFTWLADQEDIPLDHFSENYYEPGLLTDVLQNSGFLNKNPSAVSAGITLPPKINLQLIDQKTQTQQVTLQADIYNRGGGINKINFYHNRRLLNNKNIVITKNDAEHQILTITVNPTVGNNTFKVVANNDMGIENESTELNFDGKTKAYISSLRLLTVGINQHLNPKLNLKYSVTDATAIKEVIENHAQVAISKHLINEKATKARILAELKELSQGSQNDILVIYLAGHGVFINKEWYFSPYDVVLEKITTTSISATELSDIFKNSKIQHILLVVDSCHSGGSIETLSKLQNGQRHFTRKLSRLLGITVMASARKSQNAIAKRRLKHGVFTYLMVRELQYKEVKNSSITAHRTAARILKAFPIFSKKYLNANQRQEPVIYTHGNDFMLTEILKKSKL